MDAGVMENVADDLLQHDPPLAVADAEEVKHVLFSLREPATRDTPAVRSRIFLYLEKLIEELAGAPLRRAPRIDIPAPLGNFWAGFDLDGGRRGGYTDVFSGWLADLNHQPTRRTIDTILIGLQGMYNDASLTLHETGGHLSPPQQVVLANYEDIVGPALDALGGPSVTETRQMLEALKALLPQAGGKRRSQTKRFGSCVKAVRKTVKARTGSSPESAAIAICTTTLLHPRGRTIKRYRKGRLLTQRRR